MLEAKQIPAPSPSATRDTWLCQKRKKMWLQDTQGADLLNKKVLFLQSHSTLWDTEHRPGQKGAWAAVPCAGWGCNLRSGDANKTRSRQVSSRKGRINSINDSFLIMWNCIDRYRGIHIPHVAHLQSAPKFRGSVKCWVQLKIRAELGPLWEQTCAPTPFCL